MLSDLALCASLDEKIGQMLIVGFEGDNIQSNGFKKVLKQVQKGEISGVILFSKNIKSKKDLILMNEALLKTNKTPFISIDNEGGYVQRYDYYPISSAKKISKLNLKEAQNIYSKMADVEKELKINLNFAPCVDLDLNKKSLISQKERSYGSDYKIVSKYASVFIFEHNKRNIITSLKHFPGHGSATGDTHLGFVNSTDTFIKDEIEPYFALKDFTNLNTVMVSHVYNSNFDKIYPASLSEKTIDMLINGVGFKGVIISDDYDMKAIKDNYSLKDTITLAINSGINILIFSNNINKENKTIVKDFHKIVKEQIKKGNIDPQNIDNSYKKIIKLKQNLQS